MIQPFLSVCIIIKNEEKVLKRCLESIVGIADEIIIADTGSIDCSKEIAKQYTDKIFDFTWVNDFSKARNFVASKASGKWIFVIDADEYVERESFEEFTNILKNTNEKNILSVKIINFLSNGSHTTIDLHERVYLNDGNILYTRPIHEILIHKKSKENRGIADLEIYHTGYLKVVESEKAKTKRNLFLLEKKKGLDPIDYYFLGNEYDKLGKKNKAIDYYKKGYNLEKNKDNDWILKLLIRLVNSLQSVKRSSEAIEIIDSCEKKYYNLVDFKFFRGKIYFESNELDKSKDIFKYIIENNKKLVAVLSNDFLEFLPNKYLGEIYEKETKFEEAVKYYSTAIAINPLDDNLWIKLIKVLAMKSDLIELTEFLNRYLIEKYGMSTQRIIKILLSVPNINIQKLSRSFLDEESLSSYENEALLLKNYSLDGLNEEIIAILSSKKKNEIISILSKGIFTVIDLILFSLETNKSDYYLFLKNLELTHSINNLVDMLFMNQCCTLSKYEQELFLLLTMQSHVLSSNILINIFNENMDFICDERKIKLTEEIKNYL